MTTQKLKAFWKYREATNDCQFWRRLLVAPFLYISCWLMKTELKNKSVNKQMKAAFHGGYGMNNFGDDLFLQILLRYFSKNFHFDDFVIFASFPENINKMFLNDEFSDNIRAINMRDFLKVVKEIAKSKVLVLGPGEIGSCKYKYEIKNVVYLLFLVVTAKLFCTKIVFLGIGHTKPAYLLGGISKRIYYSLSDCIIVRDESSYGYLSKYKNAYSLPDVAFLLPHVLGILPAQIDKRTKGVTLILRNLEFMDKNFDKKYANLLGMLVKNGIPVTLLILSKVPVHNSFEARVADDRVLVDQIISKINKKYSEKINIMEFEVWNILNVYKVLDVIGSSDVVVSNRLHGCILAALLSKKTIILSYAKKMNMYAKQIGLEKEYLMDIEKNELNETLLYDKISKLLCSDKTNYNTTMVENMIRKSEGFDEILKEAMK